MANKIIQLNEDLIKHALKDLVRNSIEETLNALLDEEANKLVNAEKYERSSDRQGYRSDHYKRNLHITVYGISIRFPGTGNYPYVYVDGIYLKRSWGGEIQNISVLVAIGVSQDGCREILCAAEGMKEDRKSRRSFFV